MYDNTGLFIQHLKGCVFMSCCVFHDSNGLIGGLRDCPRYEGSDPVKLYSESMNPVIRLFTCDIEHRPVTFTAYEREACPVCEAHRLRHIVESELDEHIKGYARKHEKKRKHKRIVVRSRMHPKYRRRSSTGPAIVLGVCIGLVAGLFKSSK